MYVFLFAFLDVSNMFSRHVPYRFLRAFKINEDKIGILILDLFGVGAWLMNVRYNWPGPPH